MSSSSAMNRLGPLDVLEVGAGRGAFTEVLLFTGSGTTTAVEDTDST